MSRFLVAPFLSVLVSAVVPPAAAQSVTTAAISGMVRDRAGRPVPQADVEIVNRATGFASRTRSRDDGRFSSAGLDVGGPYSISIRRIGFAAQSRDVGPLTLGQNRKVDVDLDDQAVILQGVQATVASRAVSDTRVAAGTLLSDSTIHRLPTADRDLYGLVRLVPQTSSVYGTSAAGASPRMNAIMIDGSSEMGLYGGSSAAGIWGGKAISVEAVREYQVLLTPFDVRHGNFAGAMINAVTRAGSNDLHGSAFYFGRYGALSRNVPFIRDAQFERDQTGFSVGGAIVPNRAHFFVASEFQRMLFPTIGPYVGQGASATAALPVSADTVARFQSILAQYGIVGGSAGAVTAGNPLVNIFARVDVGVPELRSRLVVRENVSRADSMAFSRPSPPPAANCPTLACFALSSVGRRQLVDKRGFVAQLFTSFQNGVVNELIVGRLGVISTITPFVREPLIVVRVPSATASLQSGSYELAQADNTDNQSFDAADNLTIPVGAHTLTVGAAAQRFFVHRFDLRGAYGVWMFANLDALEAGTAQSYRVARDFGGANVTVRGAQYAVYAGDAWDLTPRLWLSYGLRLDVPTLSNRPGYSVALDTIFGRRTDNVPSGRVHVSPRLGVRYDVGGTGRTVLHGGAGLFMGRPPLAWIVNSYANYGMPRSLSCGTPRARGLAPAFDPDYANAPLRCANGIGFTLDSAGSVNLLDPRLAFPQTLRASFGVDRRLPWNADARIDVLYSHAAHELFFVNRNLAAPSGTDEHGRLMYGTIATSGAQAGRATPTPVAPAFSADVIELTNQAKDYSFSVTTQLEKRFADLLTASLSVTYGRSYDVQSLRLTRNPSFDNWRFGRVVSGRQDAPALGISDFDQPWRVIASGSYAIPWHRYTTDVSLYYLGNSGFPFTYLAGGDQNTGDLNADGTNVNDPIYVPRDANDPAEIVFDSTATLAPAAQRDAFARFVNGAACLRRQRGHIMDRNSCRTPWVNTLHLAIRQSLPAPAGRAIALEVQLFNVLNLLNPRWGRIAMPSSISAASSQVNLLTHVREIAGSPQRSVFRFDPTTKRYEAQNVDSYYQIQLGARYSF